MKRATLDDISGGDQAANCHHPPSSQGKKSPRRDVVLLNAAAALVAAGKKTICAMPFPWRRRSIDGGAAAAKLEALCSSTARRTLTGS